MNIRGKRIAVIGGAGKMGRWLSGLLLEDDFKVIIADTDEKSLADTGRRLAVVIAASNTDAIRGADYILLSVPIEGFEEVVKEIGPRVRADQVVIDITSTKERPVDLMHRHFREGRILGAHPLFGPGAASITNKNVVLTPTNDEEMALADKITAYLESKGARVSRMTPQEHDETMSLVLGLSHFIALVAADTLLSSGEIRPMETSGSSTYKVLLTLIESVLSEDPELYASLQMNFPRVTDYENLFREKTGEWADLVAGKDRREFVERMKALKSRLEKVAPDFVNSYEKMYRIVEGL
ncbi:MAG TPA: prephenate dehydrogenase [Dehalococcoidia bacterium]|nr:prephenate dehydrogenase [Dehalococcoidia bacterium]